MNERVALGLALLATAGVLTHATVWAAKRGKYSLALLSGITGAVALLGGVGALTAAATRELP